jgi:hypothetical protein
MCGVSRGLELGMEDESTVTITYKPTYVLWQYPSSCSQCVLFGNLVKTQISRSQEPSGAQPKLWVGGYRGGGATAATGN